MRFLDDFYIFCQVVEHGSMKKASEQLDVPLSTISRRVTSLEELVGTQLFIRSKTSLTPSNEGKRYYQRLSPHYQSLAEEIDNLRKDEQDVSGKVSIDCTPFVYDYFLKHKIIELVQQYPRLKLKFIPASDTSVIDLTPTLPSSLAIYQTVISWRKSCMSSGLKWLFQSNMHSSMVWLQTSMS